MSSRSPRSAPPALRPSSISGLSALSLRSRVNVIVRIPSASVRRKPRSAWSCGVAIVDTPRGQLRSLPASTVVAATVTRVLRAAAAGLTHERAGSGLLEQPSNQRVDLLGLAGYVFRRRPPMPTLGYGQHQTGRLDHLTGDAGRLLRGQPRNHRGHPVGLI